MVGIVGESPNMKTGVAGGFLPYQIIQIASKTQGGQIGGAYNTEVVINCSCDITIKNATSNLLITASPSFNQNATMRCVHLKLICITETKTNIIHIQTGFI